jgi:hypothetical protein
MVIVGNMSNSDLLANNVARESTRRKALDKVASRK